MGDDFAGELVLQANNWDKLLIRISVFLLYLFSVCLMQETDQQTLLHSLTSTIQKQTLHYDLCTPADTAYKND